MPIYANDNLELCHKKKKKNYLQCDYSLHLLGNIMNEKNTRDPTIEKISYRFLRLRGTDFGVFNQLDAILDQSLIQALHTPGNSGSNRRCGHVVEKSTHVHTILFVQFSCQQFKQNVFFRKNICSNQIQIWIFKIQSCSKQNKTSSCVEDSGLPRSLEDSSLRLGVAAVQATQEPQAVS